MNSEVSLAITKNNSGFMPDLSNYTGKVRQLIEASVAPETRRAYSSRIKRFLQWCDSNGFNTSFSISPEVLAAYLVDMANKGFKYSTIEQTLAAISTAHKAQGLISPVKVY